MMNSLRNSKFETYTSSTTVNMTVVVFSSSMLPRSSCLLLCHICFVGLLLVGVTKFLLKFTFLISVILLEPSEKEVMTII